MNKPDYRIIEENKSLKEQLESLQKKYRHDIIAVLHEGYHFKDNETRNESIRLLTNKSGLTIEVIKNI